MIEAFNEYVSNYDLNNIDIKSKYDHSLRVMELSKKYATLLGFSDEDIELATLIGLLHDIGRFEQLRVYNTYNDLRTIDHADYSVIQLFDKGLIKKFTNKEEWYPIIYHAIKYHNKPELKLTNNERINMHSKLIRDADKVDIIYLLGVLGELNQKCDKDLITPSVLETFKNYKFIARKDTKNRNDRILIQFAFAFDINNNIALKDFRKYIIYFGKQIEGGKQFDEVLNIVLEYIDKRLDKDGNEY